MTPPRFSADRASVVIDATDPLRLSSDELRQVARIVRKFGCPFRAAISLGICRETLERLVRGHRRARPSTIARVRRALFFRGLVVDVAWSN
jgi:hypothetical protein